MTSSARLIGRIIDFSVRHRFAVFAVVALCCAAGYACFRSMRLDALPDIGETQVIIYSRWERSPEILESQVTAPIVAAMLGAPHVKTVRGVSDFGYSYVYVIFDDNTDLYWARSRTLEYLSSVQAQLHSGVKIELGPDATSLGWVFQYVLVDTTGEHSLADLRAYQDWYLRPFLRSVRGVADVAPVGGFTKQYQVNLDPGRLQKYGISPAEVASAVRDGNVETSGRLMEFGGTEYMVRGRGYATSLEDFRDIVVASSADGTPTRVRDVGQVVAGPELRRGLAEFDGKGEAVSGIVIMRAGENALDVITRVKARLAEIGPSLPSGVKMVPVYDRSALIRQTVKSAQRTVLEIVVTVVVLILIFLWHAPSAIVPLVTMPVAVLLTFIPLRLLGVSVNVMSLAGIALAAGELIDASIIVVEQSHKRLEQWDRNGRRGRQRAVVLGAVKEVSGSIVFALLVIAVSVLPVFALEAQEGQMFRPLAYAKAAAMLVAAVLAVTLDPALRLWLARSRRFEFRPIVVCRLANALFFGRIRREDEHPITGPLTRLYEPIVRWTLRHKAVVFAVAAVLILATVPVFFSLGSEFLPSMDEGTILYMPTIAPGISIGQAGKLLLVTDAVLKQFPEVDHVLGKAGRAETPTDPAPLSMLETLITLKPRAEWRHVNVWYSAWAPRWTLPLFRHLTPDTISSEELVHEMDIAIRAPGLSNAWTMPVKGRIDMLTTGIRTPVGLKISGANPRQLEEVGQRVQEALRKVPGTRGVFAEQTNSGYFVDIRWRRDQLARYGISVATAQSVIDNAIGGDNVSTVVSGPERYPVNVRYGRDFRSSLDALGRVLVPTGPQRQIPLRELAEVRVSTGPGMLRDEGALLTSYVYVDLDGRDPGSYVREASAYLRAHVTTPPGVLLTWSGQYEAMQRAGKRLRIAIPITIALVLLLLYLSTESIAKTAIVSLAVPFSAIGSVWLLYLLHYNLSVAVWIGVIGLVSIDAETGVFMLLYLDLAYRDARAEGRMQTLDDLRASILYGAARRLRPKCMTFATTCLGLFPIMWSFGTGSEVMKHIAAPMIGGIFTSFLLELLVYPAVYELWKRRSLPRTARFDATNPPAHLQVGSATPAGDTVIAFRLDREYR